MSEFEHIKIFSIQSYNADFNGDATIQAILQFFQEIAWEHAEILGLGFEKLSKQNLFWVLAKQKVQIKRFPKWQDNVKVRTWPTGRDKFFWNRDFMIYDNKDNVLAIGTSTWIILDLNSRRPVREIESFGLEVKEAEHVFDEKLGKLHPLQDASRNHQKKIAYSDLDLNDHVNNVKYLEWIMDSYDLDYLKENKIDTVELNYLAEAKYGDNILINSVKKDLEHLHNVIRDSDTKELFRVRIEWK